MTAPRPDKARQNEKTPPAATGDVDRRSMLNDDQSSIDGAGQQPEPTPDRRRVRVPTELIGRLLDHPHAADAIRLLAIRCLMVEKTGNADFALNETHCGTYGVSRHSFQRGLRLLVATGVITRRQRGGTAYAIERMAPPSGPGFTALPAVLLSRPPEEIALCAAVLVSPDPQTLTRAAARIGVADHRTRRRIADRLWVDGCISVKGAVGSPLLVARPGHQWPEPELGKLDPEPVSNPGIIQPAQTRWKSTVTMDQGTSDGPSATNQSINDSSSRVRARARAGDQRTGTGHNLPPHPAAMPRRTGQNNKFAEHLRKRGRRWARKSRLGRFVAEKFGVEAAVEHYVRHVGVPTRHPTQPPGPEASRGVSLDESEVRAVARTPEERTGLEAPCGSRPRRSRAGAGWRLGGW